MQVLDCRPLEPLAACQASQQRRKHFAPLRTHRVPLRVRRRARTPAHTRSVPLRIRQGRNGHRRRRSEVGPLQCRVGHRCASLRRRDQDQERALRPVRLRHLWGLAFSSQRYGRRELALVPSDSHRRLSCRNHHTLRRLVRHHLRPPRRYLHRVRHPPPLRWWGVARHLWHRPHPSRHRRRPHPREAPLQPTHQLWWISPARPPLRHRCRCQSSRGRQLGVHQLPRPWRRLPWLLHQSRPRHQTLPAPCRMWRCERPQARRPATWTLPLSILGDLLRQIVPTPTASPSPLW